MNWKDLASNVANLAPAIGSVLAGPAGGVAGSVLASVLGTDDNADAVSKAIQTDPKAAAKIKQAELDHAKDMRALAIKARGQELDAQTAQQGRTSDVMIAELKAHGLYKSGWRAVVGYAFGLGVFAIIGSLCYTLITDPKTVDSVVTAIIWVMVTVAPVLGVNISRDARARETAMTGQKPATLIDAMATRLAGTKRNDE